VDYELVAVHTLVDALDIVQSSAVLKAGHIDVIVCGQHFEGSQMLRFLECVKRYKPTAEIPFVACRATPTHLSHDALAAMRETCEALGAVAYIDLAGASRHRGAEAAAIEFRDAVRAAVRLPKKTQALRLLVVDDNPDAAHTLSVLLRMAGHEVFKAGNAKEALAHARAQRPQVAIVDIGMPHVSGYELAGRLRAEPWASELLLVALTGHGAPEDVARARAAGFHHHFTKPVTLEQLLAVFPPGAQP
jgi:CheY-like chemotaxis protein